MESKPRQVSRYRVLIGDRQRKAIPAVAGPKLPLEVGGPQIVRRVGHRPHDAGMHGLPARAAAMHEAAPGEQIGDRARRGPAPNVAMLGAQDLEQFARAPVRMLLTRCNQELGDPRRGPMRAVTRRAVAIDQAAPAFLFIASEPLVADAATDAVARAQRTHGEAIALGVADEAKSFFHGNTLLPGHHHLAWEFGDAG